MATDADESGTGAPEWDRLKELLADILELPEGERAAAVDAACGDDDALRAELTALLAETGSSFLEKPAVSLLGRRVAAGDVIGGFTLKRLIGEGGMGRVYEAEQARPHRAVALKLLRQGFIGPEARRRFEWEAEALGRLAHPAVARVLEAGVDAEDGAEPVSWIAMELVDGEPLLAAARSLQLDRGEVLELFARICDGVAHAHAHGVIHRDLKPENILVSPEGEPHILDFGISRSTDGSSTQHTSKGELVGTLAYMAPEQVSGEPDRVDARADVYALGVILYRLLTGRPPIDLDGISMPEAVRRIAEAEPRPAGRVDRTLRGDLETILGRALERDPAARFQSVEQLSADVRRHLANEPITARPASTLYQLGKLARRHRGLAAGLALSLVLLLVGTAGTTFGFLRASRQRDRANEQTTRAVEAEAVAARERDRARSERDLARVERDRARAANAFVDRVLASPDPTRDGRDVRVAELLGRAAEDLASNSELEEPVRASLHSTLGRTFEGLGLFDEARVEMGKSAALHGHTPAGIGAAIRECLLTFETGDHVEGLRLLEELRRATASGPALPRTDQIDLMELEAYALDQADRRREHVEAWRAVVAARDADPASTELARAKARAHLGTTLVDIGRPEEAEPLFEEAYRSISGLVSLTHPERLSVGCALATCRSVLGRPKEAIVLFDELVPRAIDVWGHDHTRTIGLRSQQADALTRVGELKRALAIFEQDLPRLEAQLPPTNEKVIWARNNLAMAWLYDGRLAEAEALLRKALAEMEGSPAAQDGAMRLTLKCNLATVITESPGRDGDVIDLSFEIVEGFEEQLGEGAIQTIQARNNLMTYLTTSGRAEEGATIALENLRIAEEHHPGHPMIVFPFGVSTGRPLAKAGRYEEAVAQLMSCLEALEADPSANAFPIEYCRSELAHAYELWGKPEEAKRWRNE